MPKDLTIYNESLAYWEDVMAAIDAGTFAVDTMITQKNSDGTEIKASLLWFAASNASLYTEIYSDLAHRLLANGANVNLRSEGVRQGERTPLFQAVMRCEKRMVQLLLDAGADHKLLPKSYIRDHKTLLHLLLDKSAEFGVPVARLLIANGVDLNSAPTEGEDQDYTLLHQAFDLKSSLVFIEDLIKVGADTNITPNERNTILWLYLRRIIPRIIDYSRGMNQTADLKANLEIIAKIISNGADVNFVGKDDENQQMPLLVYVLSMACYINGGASEESQKARAALEKVFELMLAGEGVDVNAVVKSGFYKGFTPLLFAAKHGQTWAVKLLLANKTQINTATLEGEFAGQTPFWVALKANHKETVKLLLANNAEIKAPPNSAESALWFAVDYGFTDIVKLLLASAPDVNATPSTGSEKGVPLLWVAASHGFTEIVELLIAHGADVNKAPTEGRKRGVSPIWIAARNGHVDTVEALLNHGAEHQYLFDNLHLLSAEIQKELLMPVLSFSVQKAEDIQYIASIIDAVPKPATIFTPEYGEHDISFAKIALEKVKAYFADNNIVVPAYNVSFAVLRDIVVARILGADDTDQRLRDLIILSSSATEVDKDVLIPLIDRGNSNHKAYEWLMTFNQRMILLNASDYKDAAQLMRDMMCAIVACRDDFRNRGLIQQAAEMEDALVLQLDNAMDANEGTMSCAPGTPRFFRVVLQIYLDIVMPKEESDMDLIQRAVVNVIDNLLRARFKQIIDGKDIVTDWLQINSELDVACEALADFGLDNYKEVINDKQIYGRVTGEQYTPARLQERKKIFYEAYPTYKQYFAAIAANIGKELQHQLSSNEQNYFTVMYLAISNADVRERLYQSLDYQKKQLSRQRDLLLAPQRLCELITKYNHAQPKPGFSVDTQRVALRLATQNLHQMLIRTMSLLYGEKFNLEEATQKVENIFDQINKGLWRPEHAQQILDSLKPKDAHSQPKHGSDHNSRRTT